jgi:adenine/guanine phosphoribosyltransferase-like PRPP-binding protein
MPTTTTTELSDFHISLNDRSPGTSNQEWIGAMVRKARKTDWDRVIARADRAISIAGAAAVVVSILYFAPILLSILTK